MSTSRQPPARPSVAAGLLAMLVLATGGLLSIIAAFGVAYSSRPGLIRLQEQAPGLGVSVAIGLLTTAVVLGLLRQRILSPWLALALLPGSAATLSHLGALQ